MCSDAPGTIPARSSKTLEFSTPSNNFIFTFDSVCSIRSIPTEGDIVIEIVPNTMNRLTVSSFSRFHHVSLPSVLMNLDALVPRVQTPKLEGKVALNRTLSTAVPSPISTPNRQPSVVSSAVTARAACVLASVLRSWRSSNETMRARKVILSPHSRPLEAVKRGRFGECLILVSGLMIPIGHLDIEWQWSRMPFDSSDDEDQTISKREAYMKISDAAKTLLDCRREALSRSEILEAVGPSQSDMSTLLAGALLLNELQDSSQKEQNGVQFSIESPSCLVVS
jgi:hypothetical protein